MIEFSDNAAAWDRALRLLTAVALVAAALLGDLAPPWELGLLVLSVYPLVTGLLGWDPVYVLLGYRGTRGRPDG